MARLVGFIGPSYTLQSVNVDCQRTVNLFPEINALGTGKEREVASLVSTPGLKTELTLPVSITRGCKTAANGDLYWVAGSKLYKISENMIATELGTLLTDKGYVSIADNGIQLVIVDGTYGYYLTIATNVFTQITDESFYPSSHVAYQDGYFIFNRLNSGQWFISELNGIAFDGLDIASGEASPDNTVAVVSNNQNVFIIGSKSIEVFYNSGDADFPFARIQGAVIDVGCAAPYSVARIIGSIFWLGGDENGFGIIYKLQGYQAVRVSTYAIEKLIRSLTTDQISLARGQTYQQGGHLFYCLNIPGLSSTWCYDVSTDMWHERTYLNSWYSERHRAECHAVAYGKNMVGDYQNGKVYSLDENTYTDDNGSIERIRTAIHISKEGNFIRHNSFKLDLEVGVGTSGINQGNDPQVMLTYSDDGGHSWSNERWADVGKTGKTKTKVQWQRLGMSRDRVYKVKITDPVKVVLISADIDTQSGDY